MICQTPRLKIYICTCFIFAFVKLLEISIGGLINLQTWVDAPEICRTIIWWEPYPQAFYMIETWPISSKFCFTLVNWLARLTGSEGRDSRLKTFSPNLVHCVTALYNIGPRNFIPSTIDRWFMYRDHRLVMDQYGRSSNLDCLLKVGPQIGTSCAN